jgi:hypothetical protein
VPNARPFDGNPVPVTLASSPPDRWRKKSVMQRTILLAIFLPFVSAFLGGLLAINLAPPPAEAQDGRLRAEQFSIVGDNGVDRIHLRWAPGVATSMQLMDVNGDRRLAS